MCVECGHHVKVDGWHAPCGRNTVVDPLPDDAHDDYHDRLRAAVERISGRQRQRRPDVPDMWRALSGYGNYIMHSRTREVWRQAYDRTLSNGGIRHYPARRCTLTNGAYSLTVDGVTSSRGVNALWNDTFPEFAHCKGTKKKVGEWAGEIEFRRNELGDYRGLAEWLSDGGASIVTRPH
jgi:muconolactone delta-isomerase